MVQIIMRPYLKIFKMKYLLLLLLFFTGIARAQVMPFGMMNTDTAAVPVYVPNATTKGLTAVWDSQNLDVSTYKDGTVITQIIDGTGTGDAWTTRTVGEGAWAYSDFTETDDAGLGKFYDFYAVSNTSHGGLAPEGWRIPTKADFLTLITDINEGTVESNSESTYVNKLKTTEDVWNGSTGTDLYNFTAFPTGGIRDNGGKFSSFQAYWWTSDSINASQSIYVKTTTSSSDGQILDTSRSLDLGSGLSVRLVSN
jgi:uncharacterized protein (TIGR02145 family)